MPTTHAADPCLCRQIVELKILINKVDVFEELGVQEDTRVSEDPNSCRVWQESSLNGGTQLNRFCPSAVCSWLLVVGLVWRHTMSLAFLLDHTDDDTLTAAVCLALATSTSVTSVSFTTVSPPHLMGVPVRGPVCPP